MRNKEKSGKNGKDYRNLRAEAETKFASDKKLPSNLEKMTQEELMYELRVHQIELEMQNEELRSDQDIILESRDKYAELYDFAPSGYVTLQRDGMIFNANLTASKFFGVDRHKVIGASFRKFV